MQTFKIFVVGPFSSGKTTFIQSISEIGVVSTEARGDLGKVDEAPIPALDFGRLTLHEDLVLYLFGHTASLRMDRTFEYLGQRGLPLSETGFVLVMDSAHPDVDRENAHFRRYIQDHNRPYLVALSKQDLPHARTPLQMREILNIPDDIKVLSYDWKDPKTTKQVVLELVKLFPLDELSQQVMDGLKAKIDEA
jgi:uncharacterized protein